MDIFLKEQRGETWIPHMNLCILPFLSWILKEKVLDVVEEGCWSDRPVSPPSERIFKEFSLRDHRKYEKIARGNEIEFITVKSGKYLRVSSSSSGDKAIAESQKFCIMVFAASLLPPTVLPTYTSRQELEDTRNNATPFIHFYYGLSKSNMTYRGYSSMSYMKHVNNSYNHPFCIYCDNKLVSNINTSDFR